MERWTGGLLAYLHPLRPQLASSTLGDIVSSATALLKPKLEEKQVAIIDIIGMHENGQIILRIADHGPSMPFVPEFSQLTPGPSAKHFGTGLGIPFAFKVCETHGGGAGNAHLAGRFTIAITPAASGRVSGNAPVPSLTPTAPEQTHALAMISALSAAPEAYAPFCAAM